MTTLASKKLMSLLTTPSKIAMALDWRKVSAKVLTLGIHQDHIGLTLATHPSFAGNGNNSSTSASEVLADLPLTKRGDWTPEALKRLASIVEENRVCGLVVNWPIQQDTGRMGAACGRVLHTLEDLIAKDADLVSSKRPVCLWDGAHAQRQSEPVDAWGRCASFGRATDKTEHRASVEQYHEDERMAASSVWQDFCQVHWPKAYQPLDLSSTANTTATSKSMLAWSKASKKYATQSQ